MNEISNAQLITAVNQVLMSANLPTTNEVVQYVIQRISTGYFSFPQKEKMTGLLGK